MPCLPFSTTTVVRAFRLILPRPVLAHASDASFLPSSPATELYEYGWAQSFHFCRFYAGEAFKAAVRFLLQPPDPSAIRLHADASLPTCAHRSSQLARHEHYLAAQLGLKAGMRVLDVGCGVGGPAREIARFSDATIVGLNNNDFQIQRARKYTAKAGLSDTVSFAKVRRERALCPRHSVLTRRFPPALFRATL
jgi:SAM-dependent methyltransferase